MTKDENLHHFPIDRSGPWLDERVCYYDINAASSFANLQPVRQYAEHEDLITCVSLFPPNHNIFMSGSRDFTVRVWDRRRERCVGMFGTVSKTGRLQAHDAMITCLDAIDTNFILSAGMDTRVLRWDFRTLANQVSLTLFMPCCEPKPPDSSS
jgi:WD40 repeat protein